MRLLEFTSPDCKTCGTMEGFVAGVCEGLGVEHVPKDVTVWPLLARAYGISALPTFVLVGEDDGFVGRVSGGMSKERLIKWLKENT